MMDDTALLHLLHLVSPALPVGAYAYSQGQESAVEQGYINDFDSTRDWIGGVLGHSLARLDLPLLNRQYAAWHNRDLAAVMSWNEFLLASRESAEFELEDTQMGRALMRLLAALQVDEAEQWSPLTPVCFTTAFALAGVHWHIELPLLRRGFCWSWLENQVSAATKLVPLGQTQAQQLLLSLMADVDAACHLSEQVDDDALGAGLPGLALISARHEHQYSRLFRS